MSQVVPAFVGIVRTGIQEGLTYGTCWDVLSSPKACWDHRTVRGNPGHLCQITTKKPLQGTMGSVFRSSAVNPLPHT